GSVQSQKVDVRLIAATHRDLKNLAKAGQFREDLYYRLCGMRMRLPALRERSDRRELIDALLSGLSAGSGLRLSAEAHRCLLGHAWPGNVRQLLNALRQAVALAEGGVI
ncbi:sigma 54-interacting transcriptional regulator, partial [Klebsiella pneumoniae]|nr:sigma 54-interacting transcriptional regulator [Klebsiella pneumoniae]